MGKSKKRSCSSATLKEYLPVRIKLPEKAVGTSSSKNDQKEKTDVTFFYVKEHQEGNSASTARRFASDNHEKSTLFVANAPVVPGVQTKLLLKTLFGRYGDIERVSLVEDPRRRAASTAAVTKEGVAWGATSNQHLMEFFPTYTGPIYGAEKFAHVVFKTSKEMRAAMKALSSIMSKEDGGDGDDNLPGIKLLNVELQLLRDETERLYREEMAQDDSDEDEFDMESNDVPKKQKKGILVVAERYRSSLSRISRDKLLEECNLVMQEYEEAEIEQRLAREAAENEPDEDGFITVTSNSVGVEGGKNELEKSQGQSTAALRRKNGQKRNRKKKDVNGASELQDFYRFQRKETRKRTLQDLRKQFEQDLERVKKMKEDQKYKPF